LIAGFATFYLCLRFSSDAMRRLRRSCPAIHGCWLSRPAFQTPVFRVESHLRTKGMLFVPRIPGVVLRFGFPDGSCRIPDAAYACFRRAVSDLCVEYVLHSYSSALIMQHWEHR
jgi:hypothetical protein